MMHLGFLFASGVVQVTLVALNTYQISRRHFRSALMVGFLISWVWAHNVRWLAFGGEADIMAYALGAGAGTIFGIWLGERIHSPGWWKRIRREIRDAWHLGHP